MRILYITLMRILYITLMLVFFMSVTYKNAPAQIIKASSSSVVHVEKNKPSIFLKTWFKFKLLQKKINQSITKYMRDFKNGDSSTSMAFILLLAFLYGVIHAFGPGHGKFIIVSYLLSQNAKYSRGIIMGFRIAFLHSLSAILLVFITNNIAIYVLGGNAYREIKIISYLAMLFVGFWMIYNTKKCHSNHSCGMQKENKKSEWMLSLSVGMIPCTGALLILFYAMSQQMMFLGISLVIAIALGIAVSLSTVGIICSLTRSYIAPTSENKKRHKISTVLEYAGACFIVLISLILLAAIII